MIVYNCIHNVYNFGLQYATQVKHWECPATHKCYELVDTKFTPSKRNIAFTKNVCTQQPILTNDNNIIQTFIFIGANNVYKS
jgi:hypothetical protein